MQKSYSRGFENFFYKIILKPLISKSKIGREAISGGTGKGLFVEHVYQNHASGQGIIGKIVDKVLLNLPSAKATKFKKDKLIDLIQSQISVMLPGQEKIKIVDLGSGPARYLIELSKGKNKGLIQSLCLDIDQESLDFGRASAQGSPIEYRLGNITRLAHYRKLSLKSGWVPNIAIISTCFEFLQDGPVRACIEELYKALQPQGTIIIVNQVKNPNEKLFQNLAIMKTGERWNIHCRDLFVIKKWLTEAGFRNVETSIDRWGMYGYYVAHKTGVADNFAKQKPIFSAALHYKRACEQRSSDVYQYMRGFTPLEDGKALHGGHKVIMMASNNYFGLAMREEVKNAAIEAVKKYGVSTTSSRILTGNLDIHEQLQEELANFFNVEDALVFSTGYMCNVGVIGGLLGEGDVAFIDRDAHASIIDGAMLSNGEHRFFAHNNMANLEELLGKYESSPGKLIVCDGVYSMDGDLAHLPEICALAERYKAGVAVDEGHVTGIFGDHGRGTAEHFKLEGKVDLILGSLGKALASVGGFVAGRHMVIDYLRHTSRPLIFSTSLSPANAAAALEALRIIQREPWLRERLWSNTKRMREGLIGLGYNVGKTQAPLIPVIIGNEATTYKMVMALEQRGIIVDGVSFPAVKKNMSRIRIRIIATHATEDIDAALERFKEVGRKFGIIS